MLIIYCDLCGLPIKDQSHTLDLLQNVIKEGNVGAYIQQESVLRKHVCTTCKAIIFTIFDLRLGKFISRVEEIKKIYDMPYLNSKEIIKNLVIDNKIEPTQKIENKPKKKRFGK